MLSASRSRAYPLVLAGTVTGVLEVSTTRVDPDTEAVLGSLLSTAAAALESAHLHDAARELADHDGLTRLPNRRRFDADVVTEWERCRRYGRPLSLVMLDLDRFKAINAQHGHLVGDQALREVAKAVSASLRTTDTAYRYAGEELVVLLRETGLQEAAAVSERLRRAVGAVRVPHQPRVHLSASAGVATRHVRMQHHADLVAEADEALSRAKALGRDRVVTAWSGGETLFHGAAEDEVDPVTYR
jgi:diguanylate cyclase (GGDEF)-like protein